MTGVGEESSNGPSPVHNTEVVEGEVGLAAAWEWAGRVLA